MKMAGSVQPSRKVSTPKLDLFNFDSPENQSSRYILTSPRSLKACSRLRIKPVDLLPKTLQQFGRTVPSLKGEGLEAVYCQWKRDRRKRLQAAKRERERLIAELEGRGQYEGGGHDSVESGTPLTRSVDSHSKQDDKVSIKEKDQRILTALEAHYASEEWTSLLSQALKLQRDLTAKREQLDKELRDRRQQRDLSHSQFQFKHQLSELESLQAALESDKQSQLLHSLESKWKRFNDSAQLQARARYQRIKEKRYQEEKKKRLQEQRLCELEKEKEESLKASTQYLRELEGRACENRAVRAHNQSMERQQKKAAAENRHRHNLSELEVELREQSETLRSHLAERDALAQQRVLSQRRQRERLIKQASDNRDQRSARAKQVMDELEVELKEWQKEVDSQCRHSLTRAHCIAQCLLAERSQRVRSNHNRREAEHIGRMEQLAMEDQQQQLFYAEEIKLKRERSASIANERTTHLEKSRQAAHASANMREKIKDKYLRNSFDKMALQAELLASLERKHSQKTVPTKSRTTLG